MKKRLIAALSLCAIVSLSAASVYAAAPTDKGNGKQKAETKAEVHIKINVESKKDTVTSVTYDTYGHPGLEHAYENVKDKPAGPVIAAKLKAKYGIDVSAEVPVVELADQLAAEGETEAAIEVQKEVIKADFKNPDHYKKLGKLNKKLGKTGIGVYINGEQTAFQVAPYQKKNTTLVPFRAISQALKAEVIWNQTTKTVTVKKGGVTVKLTVGSTTAYINDKPVTLQAAAEVKGNTTMVPLRLISEALKTEVKWEAESQTVIIVDDQL